MNVKIFKKEEYVTCEVAINGYLHSVSYQADTTSPEGAKVLQFTDHVARIVQGDVPECVLDPRQQATYVHNGEHFTGGQWEELPDDGGMAAYAVVVQLYKLIEQGKFGK